MNGDDPLIQELAELSDEEKAELLNWYQSSDDAREAAEKSIDDITRPMVQGSWADYPELVKKIDETLLWIMGRRNSKIQFFAYAHFYAKYRSWQEKIAPYAAYMSSSQMVGYIRRFIIKHHLDEVWEEKSQLRQNRQEIQLPNGQEVSDYPGMGKKIITPTPYGYGYREPTSIYKELIPLDEPIYTERGELTYYTGNKTTIYVEACWMPEMYWFKDEDSGKPVKYNKKKFKVKRSQANRDKMKAIWESLPPEEKDRRTKIKQDAMIRYYAERRAWRDLVVKSRKEDEIPE